MKRSGWLAAALVVLSFSPALAGPCSDVSLECLNQRLHGQVVDHTHNHGADNRIWSDSLTPAAATSMSICHPIFDAKQRYPFMLWLHGFGQDEQSFVHHVVEPLDCAIASGKLPPMIIAAPDGSLNGEPSFLSAGSFFINSKAGRFEDFLMQDVWNFVLANYPIRPEREAHVIAGVSMGGGSGLQHGHQVPRSLQNGDRHLPAAQHALGRLSLPLHGQV